MEEEHEMYGADIPEYDEEGGEMETDSREKELDAMKRKLKEMDEEAAALKEMQGKMAQDEEGGEMETDSREKELDAMKRKLKEMDEEAAALKEMQGKMAQEMQVPIVPDPAADQASKEEADSRSVFVGNVDYSCTPEEVQQHFQFCGTVNRVTIKTDKFGNPKGFAFVEFMEAEAVSNALLLNQSELHNRQLKVAAKRTNVPGMNNRSRGRRFNPPPPPYAYPPPPPPYGQPYFYSPSPQYGYGYGKTPRFRRARRYQPYY